MNILQRSLILGNEIKKIKLALDLKESYESAKTSITDDWNLFYNAAKTVYGYDKIPIGLEIIKANKENTHDTIRKSVNNILKSEETLNFCKNMNEFKKIINEIIYSVSQPFFLENNVLFQNQDIEREYRQYYVDFIKLEIVQRLLSYKVNKNFEDNIKKVEKLNEEIQYLHFWDEKVINEINKICLNSEEKKILTVCNILISITALIEQVIYENHFDMITFLNINDIEKYNKIETNIEGLYMFELEIYYDYINNYGWIMFIQNKESIETLLITDKTIKFIPEQKAIIKGFVYPNDDRLFINKYINNIK